MLSIERINDLQTCKQVALLLDRECGKLLSLNQTQARELARLKGEDETQAQVLEVAKLQQRIAQLEKMIFGSSSERRPHAEECEAPEPKPRKGHGPRQQPELPLRQVVHELPTEARQCPECQGSLAEWTDHFETSEEITVIRRRYEIVQHQRQKYRCQCADRHIVTTPGPVRLIPGGRYSTEFAVEVALDKYLNHLPLDRQRKMMHREGLNITTQGLWDQIGAVADCLRPTWSALKQFVLSEPMIHADETRWMLLTPPESEQWQAWGIASAKAVYYKFQPSRSTESGSELLTGYRGVVMVDGYEVYKAIARGSPGMSLAHCWAHYPEPAVIRSARRIVWRARRQRPDPVQITRCHHSDSRKVSRSERGRQGPGRRAANPECFQNVVKTWRFMSRLVLR